MAGGTDLVPRLKRREIKAPEYIIDLKGVPNLDYIKYEEDKGLKLGALATIRAVATSPIIQDKFSILFQAANSMASVQVRNRGTLAGNICNAIPSADTAPALLILGAKVKLINLKGERFVNAEDFFVGPGEAVLNDDEILGEIQVPNPPPQSRGVYLKLTPRRSMDLAIVGVAVVLTQVVLARVPLLFWILPLTAGLIIAYSKLVYLRNEGFFEHSNYRKLSATVYYTYVFIIALNLYNAYTHALLWLIIAGMFFVSIAFFMHTRQYQGKHSSEKL